MLVMYIMFLIVIRFCFLIFIGIFIVRMILRSIEDIFLLILKLNINVFNDFVILGKIFKFFFYRCLFII